MGVVGVQEEEEKQAAIGKKRKGPEPVAPKPAPGVKKVGCSDLCWGGMHSVCY